jgi:hypothetical protein
VSEERSEAAKAIDAQINARPEGVSYVNHIRALRAQYEALGEDPPWFKRYKDEVIVTNYKAVITPYEIEGQELLSVTLCSDPALATTDSGEGV